MSQVHALPWFSLNLPYPNPNVLGEFTDDIISAACVVIILNCLEDAEKSLSFFLYLLFTHCTSGVFRL